MSEIETKLTEIRKTIDAIDQQLQTLLNQRAECALEVAKIKRQAKNGVVVYRPEREAQILRKIMARNTGPLPKKDMAEIFLFILAKSRALQQPIKIAFLGPKNSLSQKAMVKHFGKAIKTNITASVEKIFRDVVNKKVPYGVIPIENLQEGVITRTLEALTEFAVQICGEIELANSRFLIIGNESATLSGDDKTSLAIFIANKPGSLAKILMPFANHQVNVTFVEYFPYHGNIRNYVFFVDVEGHQQDEAVRNALEELSKQSLTYTILGSYPKAVL